MVLNGHTAVHCDDLVLAVGVLEFLELVGDLQCQLTSGCQYDGQQSSSASMVVFEVAFHSEALDQWQTECECLAAASEISGHHVVCVVDGMEGVGLHWHELSESSLLEQLD